MNRDTQIVKVICLTMQVVLFAIITVLAVAAVAASDNRLTAVIAITAMTIVEVALWWIECRMDDIEAEREAWHERDV